MPYVHDYAAALRSIGQALEKQHIEVFEIKHHGSEFFLQCGDPNPPYINLLTLRYSVKDLEALDVNGRTKRGQSGVGTELSSLPETLRGVGKYLESKNAQLVRFCNTATFEPSVELEYENSDRTVRSEKLSAGFILGVCTRMYQNRGPTIFRTY
jgi:hypothetical protein